MAAARDYGFEALAEVTNTDWNTGRGELNAALKSIREQVPEIEDSYLLGAEIHDRAKLYRALWPDMSLTPTALAKHWKRVVEEKPPRSHPVNAPPSPQSVTCPQCEGNKMVWVTDDAVAPCPTCNSEANADFWRHDGSRFVARRL